MSKGVTGIILAGGRSSRMGCNKAFLPWNGTTLIEQVLSVVSSLVSEAIIVSKDARPFRHLKVRVIEDAEGDAHALGGVATGLASVSTPLCFVCACDMPFLNPDLIRFLCGEVEGYDWVLPCTEEGEQPLHAVYRTCLLPVFREQIRNQEWSFSQLVPKVRVRRVELEVLRGFDPAGLSFVNLNTPEDVVKYRAHQTVLGTEKGATMGSGCCGGSSEEKVTYECATHPQGCPPKQASSKDPAPSCCGKSMHKKAAASSCH